MRLVHLNKKYSQHVLATKTVCGQNMLAVFFLFFRQDQTLVLSASCLRVHPNQCPSAIYELHFKVAASH